MNLFCICILVAAAIVCWYFWSIKNQSETNKLQFIGWLKNEATQQLQYYLYFHRWNKSFIVELMADQSVATTLAEQNIKNDQKIIINNNTYRVVIDKEDAAQKN